MLCDATAKSIQEIPSSRLSKPTPIKFPRLYVVVFMFSTNPKA